MIDQDEIVKLLNASTRRFDGENHLQEDGSFQFDLSQGNILHRALQIMRNAMKK